MGRAESFDVGFALMRAKQFVAGSQLRLSEIRP